MGLGEWVSKGWMGVRCFLSSCSVAHCVLKMMPKSLVHVCFRLQLRNCVLSFIRVYLSFLVSLFFSVFRFHFSLSARARPFQVECATQALRDFLCLNRAPPAEWTHRLDYLYLDQHALTHAPPLLVRALAQVL